MRLSASDVRANAASEFVQQIEALAVNSGDGTARVKVAELRALVRDDPELTVIVAQSYVGAAKDQTVRRLGNVQLAVILAAAYEAEFEDDSLSVWVADELNRAGLSSGRMSVVGDVAPEPPFRIEVDTTALETLDIYPFVSKFSHHEIDDEERKRYLRSLRGRLWLIFPVPRSDPRAVWEVDEVREYVDRLKQNLPYLPYYFDPDPEAGMIVWFRCLAPKEALLADGRLDLMNPRVAARSSRP